LNMFADAQAYERFMGRWSNRVAPRFVDFTDLPERGRMLDVGSGTGSLTFAIARRKAGASVLGIDTSKEYVAYANSRNPFRDRAGFEVGDAQQLHFPDASFDAALSLLVFNFIPDPKKALLELRRVTRPGGKLSAAVWDYGAGMRMLRTFWDAAVHIDTGAEKFDEKLMPLCRAGELLALWRQGGLENVREQPIDIEMRLKSFADFWDPFLLGQGPAGVFVRRIEHDRLHALRDEVKRRLSVSTENAPLVLPARVWSVRGTVPNHR
jgi:SAM-dependent methyltransferase